MLGPSNDLTTPKPISATADSLFLQRLRALEYWVQKTSSHVHNLDANPNSHSWTRLKKRMQTFLNSVHLMQAVEMQRTRRMHDIFDDLTGDMHDIEMMLGECDREEGACVGHVRVGLKRAGVVEGELHKTKRRRVY